jgi:hypothetical protein
MIPVARKAVPQPGAVFLFSGVLLPCSIIIREPVLYFLPSEIFLSASPRKVMGKEIIEIS